jgi:hypothetical protein
VPLIRRLARLRAILAHGTLEDLGEGMRSAPRGLGDLLAAAEAVDDDR